MLDPVTRRFSEEFTPLETKQIYKKNQRLLTGFTLFEVALAMAVFALAASGSLSLFISCSRLTDSAGHITRMVDRAREELENRVRRTDFESLDDYFFITNDPAPLSLVCYVERYDSVNPNNELNRLLKWVKIVITYRETSNRIIGEDRNLNGRLDDGEDTNDDNRLSSPCEIVSYIASNE